MAKKLKPKILHQPINNPSHLKLEKKIFLEALGFHRMTGLNKYEHVNEAKMWGWKIELNESDTGLFNLRFIEVYTNKTVNISNPIDINAVDQKLYAPNNFVFFNFEQTHVGNELFPISLFMKEQAEIHYFFLDYWMIKKSQSKATEYVLSRGSMHINNALVNHSSIENNNKFDFIFIQLVGSSGNIVGHPQPAEPNSGASHRTIGGAGNSAMDIPLYIIAPPCPPAWTPG